MYLLILKSLNKQSNNHNDTEQYTNTSDNST